MSKEILLNQIEEVRGHLNKFALTKSLVDQEVVRLSQSLDRLLNQYYGLGGEAM